MRTVSPPSSSTTTTTSLDENPYLEKVRLKRAQNKRRLEDLGFGEKFSPSERKRRRQLSSSTPKRRRRRTDSPSSTPNVVTPVRRSRRAMKQPVQYIAVDAMEDAERRLVQKLARRRQGESSSTAKAVKRRNVSQLDSTPLSEATVEKLNKVCNDDWVEDMRRYFADHQGNSPNNVMRVMTVVERLAEGVGVVHPMTRDRFWKKRKIHLGTDFRSMLDDASEWVYTNGGDRGNGWLIEHPVKKCLIYQRARVENKGSPFFGKGK